MKNSVTFKLIQAQENKEAARKKAKDIAEQARIAKRNGVVKKEENRINRIQIEIQTQKKSNTQNAYHLKSLAKAAGVKSVFAIGNDLLMTGFGPGNDATIEKRVFQNRAIETLSSPEQYSAEFQNKQFKIKGNIKVLNHSTQKMEEIQTELQDNYNRPNFDLLGCKDVLEQKYFGRTFSDNIHVQIAYNIMDIEKLLTPYINNIIYTLNELMRDNSKDDFFGCDSHFSVAYLYDELKAGYPDSYRHKYYLKDQSKTECAG